jgi:sugar lactone lactonase YvrE
VTVGLGTNPARRSELGEAGAGFAQVVRLGANGDWRDVSDIGAYEVAVNPGGGPIDSNPFGVLAEAGSRVVVDAGGNSLLRIAANGDLTTLASFPSRDDGRNTDAVPNSVAVGPDGAYYVGELTGVPFAVGAARVYRVVPGQAPQVVQTGFTAIIDVTFGPDGSLYVLQHATGPFLSGNGALIRVAPDGTRTTVASEGLINPTSVVVDDDGTIYVSNRGTFAGTGEVVRVNAATVESVVVNDGSAQRSKVNSVTVTFDRPVSFDAGAFQLRKGTQALSMWTWSRPLLTVERWSYSRSAGREPTAVR